MIRKLLLSVLLTICMTTLWAQQIQVSGRITAAEEREPLPGVSVIIEGTTSGTVTDLDGRYSIQAPANGTLLFSYIGFSSQTVAINNRSVVDVSLASDVRQLGEVVVTALGIERQTKALQYSITEVSGANFTEARENNIANQLAGRVAGVNVSNVASGPAGSSRVIIRGNTSLQGGNQPLYVIDGIPMDNSNFGQAGMWGGRDGGDGMTSINPDDIESMTVLKGASAAALYGARAANGVINIVTKKGSSRKGVGIEFNSNFVFDRINDQRDFQNSHGGGGYVLSDPDDSNSPRIAVAPRNIAEAWNWGNNGWGPRFGGPTSQSVQFDGVTRPYAYAGDNFPRFFQTGTNLTNSVALTGGNETQSFRFSLADLRGEGIVPNSGFDRQNVSLSTNGKFGQKLTFNAKVLYSHEYAKNRPRLSDSPGNAVLSSYYLPNNIDIRDYRGDPNKLGAIAPLESPWWQQQGISDPQALYDFWGKKPGDEMQQRGPGDNWHQNPYWVAHQFTIDDTRDRLITSGQARYALTDFLYVSGQLGMDWFTRRGTTITPQGTGYDMNGGVNEAEERVREINMEAMLGFNKTFGRIGVNAFVGANRMRRSNENMNINGGGGFNVPYFHAINNAKQRTFGYGFSESGINSVFGSAEISYNNVLFVTGTVRNDWFSVLNPDYNSILYPSIGASFVFSDAFNLPSALSFGKLRASWAQVGSTTIGPYNTLLTYSMNGNPHVGYPMASFSSAMGQGGSIPNFVLQPATSTEYEFGMDLRFVQNRLGLDFTYYNQRTTDDILNATISRASGFGSTIVNLGEMQNKGIEVLLTGTPVRGALTWDISINLAKNKNKVIKLIEGNDELIVEEPRNRNVFIKHIVGHPFGMITGRVQRLSPDGQPIFFNDGRPMGSAGYEIIGSGVPDLTGGVNNSFSFKGFNLNFLIDFKMGGDIISGTNMRMTGSGFHKQTLQGREGEAPLTVSGVTQPVIDGVPLVDADRNPVYEPFNHTLTPVQAQAYWGSIGSDGNGIAPMFLYDASFAKLRQVTFGYNFPRSILNKTPFQNLALSVVGRNLAILHKNVENIDPESGYSSGNGQGLDYFGMPSTRSYGVNLRVTF